MSDSFPVMISPELLEETRQIAEAREIPLPVYARGCLRLLDIVNRFDYSPRNAQLLTKSGERLPLPPIGEEFRSEGNTEKLNVLLSPLELAAARKTAHANQQHVGGRFRRGIRLGNFAMMESFEKGLVFVKKGSQEGLAVPLTLLTSPLTPPVLLDIEAEAA